MRTLPLLLAAALAIAGCSGDPETDVTASPTPTATASTSPTPSPTPTPEVTVTVDPVTVDDPDRVGQAPPEADTAALEQQAATWADELAADLADADGPADDDPLAQHRDDGDLTITATGHATHNGPLLAATVTTDSHTTDVVAVDIDGRWTIVDLEAR